MRRPRPVHRPFTGALVAVVLLLGGAGCSDADDGAADTTAPATDAPTTTDDGQRGELSVLTYNVAGLPQEISPENPEINIPLISPLLNDYDIVLTQEDFDWWKPGGLADGLDFNHYHDRLRAETTHEFSTPVHPGPEAAGVDPATRPDMEIGDGIGILSRFELDGIVRQAWKGCFGGFDTSDDGAADCLAMKGFAYATIELGGQKVDLYALHGEAGGSERDQALQADDFAELAAFITAHSAGRAIILGGDTNLHTDPDHPDSGGEADTEIWERFLEATTLNDACAELDCDDTGRIDKIAFRGRNRLQLTVESRDVPSEDFQDADGEDLSDHQPVAVTFSWYAPSPDSPG